MDKIDYKEKNIEFSHSPVLLRETLEALNIKKGLSYLDLTLGGAGHSSEILKALCGSGELFAFDQDIDALTYARKKLVELKENLSSHVDLEFFNCNFSMLNQRLNEFDEINNREKTLFDGILADIGVSSYQLDEAERGFSYQHDGPLDMRMNKSAKLTAAQIVNTYSEAQIAEILFTYGEEKNSRRIARAIVEQRKIQEFKTTAELRDCICGAKIRLDKSGKHPAKRSFQALRIAVNSELEVLESMLSQAIDRLKPGGRLVIISFHSLEDRIVKNFFKAQVNVCTCPPKMPCICGKEALGKIIYPKGLTASEEELKLNLRSRSARLRCFEKRLDS